MGRGGFTLVETLIALALISILSAIAIPSFYSWSSSLRHKEAAWSILGDMRVGKQLAMSTNFEHRIELDVDAKRFRITRGDRPSGSTAWTEAKAWSGLPGEVTLSSGGLCDQTADLNIAFRPNGSAESATVCVKEGSTVRYRVVVNATSGRAAIN